MAAVRCRASKTRHTSNLLVPCAEVAWCQGRVIASFGITWQQLLRWRDEWQLDRISILMEQVDLNFSFMNLTFPFVWRDLPGTRNNHLLLHGRPLVCRLQVISTAILGGCRWFVRLGMCHHISLEHSSQVTFSDLLSWWILFRLVLVKCDHFDWFGIGTLGLLLRDWNLYSFS